MRSQNRYACGSPFATLREFDRMIGRALDSAQAGPVNGGPEHRGPVGRRAFRVDVYEADDVLVLEAELPGYAKDQIDVSVEGDGLTIAADRGDAPERGESHVAERRWSTVSRRFTLPAAYDATRIDAELEHGVLTLTLPKRDEVKPRKVEIA